MQNQTLIMLIGKTHSGKTTFANELKSAQEDLLIIEADPIAVFMKEHYPELRFSDDTEHTGEFKDISLKFKVFLLFIEFAMNLKKPIVLSNSNMWINGRKLVFELCKKCNYTVTGVYLDFPEEVIIERIKNSDRSTDVLKTSKGFEELIINQRTRMQPPESSGFAEFFTAHSEEDLEEIKKVIIAKLK